MDGQTKAIPLHLMEAIKMDDWNQIISENLVGIDFVFEFFKDFQFVQLDDSILKIIQENIKDLYI